MKNIIIDSWWQIASLECQIVENVTFKQIRQFAIIVVILIVIVVALIRVDFKKEMRVQIAMMLLLFVTIVTRKQNDWSGGQWLGKKII